MVRRTLKLGAPLLGVLLLVWHFYAAMESRARDERLWLAIATNQVSVAEALVDQGANVGRVFPDRSSMLWAAIHSQNPQLVRFVLDHKVPIDSGWREGPDALIWAAGSGNSDIVQTLIERGVDVNARNGGYMAGTFTPLTVAALDGRTRIVQMLLLHGADPTICENYGGSTPMQLAISERHWGVVKLLRDYERKRRTGQNKRART